MIHNNIEIPSPTGGAINLDVAKPGPVLLQDHSNLVRYRNVWAIRIS
jgi:hypothetical protein